MNLLIINGPNLNLLGRREKDLYGTISFEEYLEGLRRDFPGHRLDYFQSNVEGLIIDKIQESEFNFDGIVLNAGGYTHTSVSIADAVRAVDVPVIEVHLTNLSSREEFRHRSLITPHSKGMIMGFGLGSYRLAIEYFGKISQ